MFFFHKLFILSDSVNVCEINGAYNLLVMKKNYTFATI